LVFGQEFFTPTRCLKFGFLVVAPDAFFLRFRGFFSTEKRAALLWTCRGYIVVKFSLIAVSRIGSQNLFIVCLYAV